jgi:hypothetical protein
MDGGSLTIISSLTYKSINFRSILAVCQRIPFLQLHTTSGLFGGGGRNLRFPDHARHVVARKQTTCALATRSQMARMSLPASC